MNYDDLAAGLEDAWIAAGLHDHLLQEAIIPETFERTFKAELFPEHPEPLGPGPLPPWVEVNFTWTAEHQLRSEGQQIIAPALELSWSYNVDARGLEERSDADLARMFQGSVRSALRRLDPELSMPADYVAIEVRRAYHSTSERPVLAYVMLVGTNATDVSELWEQRDPLVLQEAIGDELQIVAAVLHALGEAFAPRNVGPNSYRSVESA